MAIFIANLFVESGSVSEVKQFAEEPAPPLPRACFAFLVPPPGILVIAPGFGWARVITATPFQDLVEFAAIEPYAPALGAVVDLDALAFGHHEGCVTASRASHRVVSRKWFGDPTGRFGNLSAATPRVGARPNDRGWMIAEKACVS